MRLLVVGLGSVGQRHVRCLRALRGEDLTLLAFRQRGRQLAIESDLSTREADLEALYGIESFTSLDEALSRQPQAALVCTPNHLHVPLAIELAGAGLDLFLEKPVSHTLEGVDTLHERLEKKGRVCCVGYQLRFHPAIERMVEIVRGGRLGTVFGAHVDFGEYMPFWHRYEDYAETFMARDAEGGGVTLTQIHDLDVILALFGMPDSVYASGGSSGTLRMDAEDNVSSVLSYRRGDAPFAVSVDQDCLRHPPRRVYEVRGSDGVLRFDYYANELLHVPFEGDPCVEWSDPDFARDTLFLRQMEHFLACVAREASPRVDLVAGVDSLRMALAIRASLRSTAEVAP